MVNFLSYNESVSSMECMMWFSLDIDECLNLNGGCSQKCVNTPGAFYCECNPGYNLGVDKTSCIGESASSVFEITFKVTTSNSNSISKYGTRNSDIADIWID